MATQCGAALGDRAEHAPMLRGAARCASMKRVLYWRMMSATSKGDWSLRVKP
jgi:hypothetical protein